MFAFMIKTQKVQQGHDHMSAKLILMVTVSNTLIQTEISPQILMACQEIQVRFSWSPEEES